MGTHDGRQMYFHAKRRPLKHNSVLPQDMERERIEESQEIVRSAVEICLLLDRYSRSEDVQTIRNIYVQGCRHGARMERIIGGR